MNQLLGLGRFSLGTGDRFARQAEAQLHAFELARKRGIDVTPVWNKSFREHAIVGTEPSSVRAAADKAVARRGWTSPYFIDADHIRMETVGAFMECCDFFTIDVADRIDRPADADAIAAFVSRHPELARALEIEGVADPIGGSAAALRDAGCRFLAAVLEAAGIYRHIRDAKGAAQFLVEVSMDETAAAQTPYELLVILAALADEGVPVDTIAPRFSGRFNKGVDYVGDAANFEREFGLDVAVLQYAVSRYGLPASLKLSVHSGSDKFSIYPAIRRVLQSSGAGVHVKTAGTTWLEELIGLAEAGGEGLDLAKHIYQEAFENAEALCRPYAEVIGIDPARLPSPAAVLAWSSEQFVSALRHDARNPAYNPHLRQLLHVGYKVAAKAGQRYFDALEACAEQVSRNVTTNLLDRHILPLFAP